MYVKMAQRKRERERTIFAASKLATAHSMAKVTRCKLELGRSNTPRANYLDIYLAQFFI